MKSIERYIIINASSELKIPYMYIKLSVATKIQEKSARTQKKKPNATFIELKLPCRGPIAATPPTRKRRIPNPPSHSIHCSPFPVNAIITENEIGNIPQDNGYRTALGLGFSSIFCHPKLSGDLSLALTIKTTTHHQMDDVNIDSLLHILHQPYELE